MRNGLFVALALFIGTSGPAVGYPLDGRDYTHIDRLTAYYLAMEPLLERGTLKPGMIWSMDNVQPRLTGQPNFEIPEVDAAFTASIKDFLGPEARYYGVAVLDLTEPDAPRYAEINGARVQNPASVGKIAVALAFFQALADVYPDDIQARERILRDTIITANEWSQTDHHTVPMWKPGDPAVIRRPIEVGDQANLWAFLDHMMSASSNGAASQLMSELLLLRHFGKEYPPAPEAAAAFFSDTSKSKLSKMYLKAMLEPLDRNGIDRAKLRQGGFFTRAGKHRIPGTNSVATPQELMRYLVLMEEGMLVDPWSSMEIKRLLYLTDVRIRYASHPALNDSAVYFKSGSLYSCKKEAGFTCNKYMGNRLNYMNSIAVVETDEDGSGLQYIVVVLSNVLKKNSAVDHQTFAMRIHRLIEGYHAEQARAREAAAAAQPVGSETPSPAY
jgi:hypothetical protein